MAFNFDPLFILESKIFELKFNWSTNLVPPHKNNNQLW